MAHVCIGRTFRYSCSVTPSARSHGNWLFTCRYCNYCCSVTPSARSHGSWLFIHRYCNYCCSVTPGACSHVGWLFTCRYYSYCCCVYIYLCSHGIPLFTCRYYKMASHTDMKDDLFDTVLASLADAYASASQDITSSEAVSVDTHKKSFGNYVHARYGTVMVCNVDGCIHYDCEGRN